MAKTIPRAGITRRIILFYHLINLIFDWFFCRFLNFFLYVLDKRKKSMNKTKSIPKFLATGENFSYGFDSEDMCCHFEPCEYNEKPGKTIQKTSR